MSFDLSYFINLHLHTCSDLQKKNINQTVVLHRFFQIYIERITQ